MSTDKDLQKLNQEIELQQTYTKAAAGDRFLREFQELLDNLLDYSAISSQKADQMRSKFISLDQEKKIAYYNGIRKALEETEQTAEVVRNLERQKLESIKADLLNQRSSAQSDEFKKVEEEIRITEARIKNIENKQSLLQSNRSKNSSSSLPIRRSLTIDELLSNQNEFDANPDKNNKKN